MSYPQSDSPSQKKKAHNGPFLVLLRQESKLREPS